MWLPSRHGLLYSVDTVHELKISILYTERTHESENKEVKMFTITYEGEAKSHIHKLMRYTVLSSVTLQ